MAGRDKESQEIMSASMRYVKTGDRSNLEVYSLPLLKKADYQLSDRDLDSGYRNAIKDLIIELENYRACTHENSVVDIKPNFYGLGINFNELFRRAKKNGSQSNLEENQRNIKCGFTLQ